MGFPERDIVDFVQGDGSLGFSAHPVELNSTYLGDDFSILLFFKFMPGGDVRFWFVQDRRYLLVDMTISRAGNQLQFFGSNLPLGLYTSVPGEGLQPNRWYHFAWIVERANARWTIYIDGERTFIPADFVPPLMDTRQFYEIRDIRHKMDDFRVYSVALSQHEVRTAYLQRDLNEICGLTNSNSTTCPRLCRVNPGYQITPSGANVQLCPANSYQNGSALTCQSCPVGSSTNTSGNTDISACVCAVGYTREIHGIGACKPCDAGTYKVLNGSHDCTMCPLNSISPTASTNIQNCTCQMGYTGANGQNCTACVLGTFKDVLGSAPCLDCNSNTVSEAASISDGQCHCIPGYRRNVFVNVPGTNSDLATLRTGTDGWRLVRFLPPTSKTWYKTDKLRGFHSYGTPYNYDTEWTVDFGVFDQFLIGTFRLAKWVHFDKSVTLHETINTKEGGIVRTSVFQTSANKNPHALTWHIAGEAAIFLYGRPWISVGDFPTDAVYATTTAAHMNLVSTDGGMAVWVRQNNRPLCRECEVDTYSDMIGASVCIKCPENSQALVGSSRKSACICRPGYTSTNGGVCLACPTNTYKTNSGSQSCLTCPVDTISGEGSSVCQCIAGFTGPNNGPCVGCPVGTAKGVPGTGACMTCSANTTSKSEGSSRCVCVTGMYGKGLVWAHETVIPVGLQHTGNIVDCIPCPLGYIISSTDETCVSCQVNTYNPTPLGVQCIACPNNTRSPSASVKLTDCKCRGAEYGDTGFSGPDGGPCESCPADHYKGISLRSGSCDKIVKSNSTISFPYAINTPLRNILALSFRDNWILGDQVHVHRSGSRGINDVVLTYTNSFIRGGYWMPSNVNPLLRINDTYRFFVKRAILLQKNASESGIALGIV